MPITLAELLESRDKRVEHQKDLLGEYPGKSLLCLTVQLPGPEKRNATSLKIAQAGVEAVRMAFSPVYEELKDLETGYEAYFLVDLPAKEAKRRACQIEDTHPLGRLMDMDVVYSPTISTRDGSVEVEAISRLDIGLEARKCLLCDNEVRYCMRAKTHTREELLSRIEQILKEYELQAPNPRTD
jgi:holo-ACP synthase CitX